MKKTNKISFNKMNKEEFLVKKTIMMKKINTIDKKDKNV